VDDCRAHVAELVVQLEMDFGFAREVAVAVQLVALQVYDEHVLRLKLPAVALAAVAGRQADDIANTDADIAAAGVGQVAFEHERANPRDVGAGFHDFRVHVLFLWFERDFSGYSTAKVANR